MRIALAMMVLFPVLFFAGISGAGDSAAVSVSATVRPTSNCKFSNPSSLTLNFGALDPGDPVDVTASGAVGFRCAGSAPIATFSIADDDGLYETGPNANRMRHFTVPAEYLVYTLSVNPTSGTVPKNAPRTLTISGTVRGADYRNSYAGNYSDSVVITLLP